MMKKVIIGFLIFLIIIILGGYLVVRLLLNSMDQVKLQYDNEVISSLKRELDFHPFEEGLSKMTDEKFSFLRDLTLQRDIDAIQQAIVDKKVTCQDLILFYVGNIKAYDSHYNTVLQLNPRVLEQAKRMDEEIQAENQLRALTGVIVLIKDNISSIDMNTASGAYALRNLTTSRDAFVVEQLKKQGALILGKANLSEWSNYVSLPSSSGFSVLGGQTKNAYGKYDVGGSSSGSAAAVALNFATVTLGSETSGSLVYPASQNSVVALKPTIGLLSRDLIIPITEAQDTAGVIGATVEEVHKVFANILAVDEEDRMTQRVKEIDLDQLKGRLDQSYLSGKRVGLIQEDPERARNIKFDLEQLGAEVVEINMPSDVSGVDMLSVLRYGIIYDVNAFLNNKDVHSEFKSLEEILAYNKEDEEKRAPFGQKLHEEALTGDQMSKEDYEALVKKNRELSGELIDNMLKDHNIDVIVSFSNELSSIYAPATYPAITVPAGYKESGEPYGVTFIASFYQDNELLHVAYAYEQGTRHRKEPMKQK